MSVHEVVFVLCDRVQREAKTNKATLDGLFDRVNATTFPAALNAFLYIRFLGATGGNVELRLTLNRPNGSKEQLPPFVFKCLDGKVEGEINVQGLPLLGKGRHSFSLSWNGTAVGSASFNVDPIAPTQVENVSPQAAN